MRDRVRRLMGTSFRNRGPMILPSAWSVKAARTGKEGRGDERSCTIPLRTVSPSPTRCPMLRTSFAVPLTLLALGAISAGAAGAAPPPAAGDRLDQEIDRLAAQVEPDVIACRRQIHEHPELSNREAETGKLVAERLGNPGL